MLRTSSLVKMGMVSCVDGSTDLLYPSSECKDKVVAEESAVVLFRVENDFSGGKKSKSLKQHRLMLTDMCSVFCYTSGNDMHYFALEFCMAGISLGT